MIRSITAPGAHHRARAAEPSVEEGWGRRADRTLYPTGKCGRQAKKAVIPTLCSNECSAAVPRLNWQLVAVGEHAVPSSSPTIEGGAAYGLER